MLTDKKGVARQILDGQGHPIRVRSSRRRISSKGKEEWIPCSGTLWELDGYDTFIPDGFVPIYRFSSGTWRYTTEGGPDDPFGQMGFQRADEIPF